MVFILILRLHLYTIIPTQRFRKNRTPSKLFSEPLELSKIRGRELTLKFIVPQFWFLNKINEEYEQHTFVVRLDTVLLALKVSYDLRRKTDFLYKKAT